MSESLKLWGRLSGSAAGRWLYGRLICFKAPYFATIAPRFVALAPGRCEIAIRDRRRVHNHIGTVHAIALCNMAELAGGLATDATIPDAMRWIPKGMSVRYLKKAKGTMTATARVPAIAAAASGSEVHVTVEVRDAGGEAVFDADITMWISPRKAE